MHITFSKKVINFFLLKDISRTIDANDIIGKQRLFLFSWVSLLAFVTCIGLTIEIFSTAAGPLAESVPLLGVLFVVNYFWLRWHKNKQLAYTLLISFILTEIHITSYSNGGLRNDAMYFSMVCLLGAFMLLGTHKGFFFSLLVIANQFYFYFISEHTDWVTDFMTTQPASIVNLDYLIVGTISLMVMAIMLIGLEASKNVVLNKLNLSKEELKTKNEELKKSEEKLANYLHHLEKKNEELERKNKDLDRFAYLVSHDLKAPLRAISSVTKFIEEDAGDKLPEEAHQHLEIIRGRIARMDKLITDILSYSQATRSKKSFSEFTLNDLVHDTIDLIMLPDNCKIKIQGGDSLITSDKTRLGQLMMNLIVNAIKHHHNKNEIEIGITATDEVSQWHFSLQDNGPGISTEHHDKIFQIFQTLHKRNDPESSGIGLAIVKKIIEDFDGSVWIESETGKGTTFHFTLPKGKIKVQETADAILII
jgi:signal transduction histidine kinase